MMTRMDYPSCGPRASRCHEARRATTTMYCLEILRKVEDDEMLARDGIFEHVGYEHRVDPSTGHRQIFPISNEEEAAQYYDEQTPDRTRIPGRRAAARSTRTTPGEATGTR